MAVELPAYLGSLDKGLITNRSVNVDVGHHDKGGPENGVEGAGEVNPDPGSKSFGTLDGFLNLKHGEPGSEQEESREGGVMVSQTPSRLMTRRPALLRLLLDF